MLNRLQLCDAIDANEGSSCIGVFDISPGSTGWPDSRDGFRFSRVLRFVSAYVRAYVIFNFTGPRSTHRAL
jgi:hypothetical protein